MPATSVLCYGGWTNKGSTFSYQCGGISLFRADGSQNAATGTKPGNVGGDFMTAPRILFISLTLTLAIFSASGQDADQNIRLQVLQKGIIDSTFIFGKWTEGGNTETHLTYLGQVITNHGQTFKIVNSICFWGLSHRATSRILIFNSKNQYVGNFYLTIAYDLPSNLVDGKLIFKNTDKDCDNKLTTIVDLKNGIPRQFFRKCRGTSGDIYSFSSD